MGKYGQRWAGLEGPDWQELVTYLLGECRCACRTRGGCRCFRPVLAYMNKGGQRYAGLYRSDLSSADVWHLIT